MNFNFHTNGDVYRWLDDAGDGDYIGWIDSTGNFCPAEDCEDEEEYVYTAARLTLGAWAFGDMDYSDYIPPSSLFTFAGFGAETEGDWNNETRDWNDSIRQRVIAGLTDKEKYDLGIR